MNDITFAKFVDLCEQDRLDEIQFIKDMWKHAKRGYQSGYTYWNPTETEEDKALRADGKNPTWEKFKNAVMPAIEKTKQFVNKAQEVTGVSAPLAAALLAAGVTGGVGAIPMAAFLYFTRNIFVRPVLGVAGKGFDTVFGTDEDRRKKEAEAQAAAQAAKDAIKPAEDIPIIRRKKKKKKKKLVTATEWVFCSNYNNYLLYKEIKTLGYINNISFKEWISNPNYELLNEGKILNWIGRKIGQGVGFVSGFFDNIQNKIEAVVEGSLKALGNFAKNNRIGIMKAAFLMALGVAIGHGVTKLTNHVIQQVQDSAHHAVTGQAQSTETPASTTAAPTSLTANADQEFLRMKQEILSNKNLSPYEMKLQIQKAFMDTHKDVGIYKNYDILRAKAENEAILSNNAASTPANMGTNPLDLLKQADKEFINMKQQILSDPNLSAHETHAALKQAYIDTHKDVYNSPVSQKINFVSNHADRLANDAVLKKFGSLPPVSKAAAELGLIRSKPLLPD